MKMITMHTLEYCILLTENLKWVEIEAGWEIAYFPLKIKPKIHVYWCFHQNDSSKYTCTQLAHQKYQFLANETLRNILAFGNP